MSKRIKGLYISLIGVFILSPDSLLIRLLNLNDLSLIFYRGILPAIATSLILLIYYKKNIIKAFILIGFVGMIVLLVPSGFGNFELAGMFAILGAISYAFAGIFGKKLKEYDPILNVFGMLSASSLIMYILFFPSINAYEMKSFYEFFDLILLAIVSTSLAYIIYFKLLFAIGAVKLLLVTYLIPISASILGIMLLDEKFTFNMLIGTAIIFISLYLINKDKS